MPTTKIMLIRHAERPNGDGGVMPDGTANPEALTARGWQRANALVQLFVPPGGQFKNPDLATPQTIFASGIGHHSKSLRPQQTVTPLAKKLKLSINTKFLKGDESGLAQAATTNGGIALIAWEHEAIPEIAELLVGNNQGIPQHWPGSRFDLVWVFDRTNGSLQWNFAQVPQLLLPGDSSNPIPVSQPNQK
jgi:broad specificity phosphatase PhoE